MSDATPLDNLTVHEDTDIGWCEATPPNETVDADGQPSVEALGFAASDPDAPSVRRYDHPEVATLRAHLREHNGIRGLEICAPDEIERIVRIFRRDGFVVVRDLLDEAQLQTFRDGCARVLRDLLEIPGIGERKYLTESFRLPHRYSYGTASASRQLLHDPAWASMIDLPTTTPILAAMFGNRDYYVIGSGGDLCLPGAVEYQVLHTDFTDDAAITPARIEQAKSLGIDVRTDAHGALNPLSTQKLLTWTPPLITINFCMSELTWENGPIRHIPGTHTMPFHAPGQPDEPPWMRLSTLVGAPPGAGVFRDSRAWHGATPNVSRQVRALPNVEYAAAWVENDELFKETMPHDTWETLSAHAQHISRRVVAPPGVWPAGAGAMHPTATARAAIKEGE